YTCEATAGRYPASCSTGGRSFRISRRASKPITAAVTVDRAVTNKKARIRKARIERRMRGVRARSRISASDTTRGRKKGQHRGTARGRRRQRERAGKLAPA